jgi:hypothetical protein
LSLPMMPFNSTAPLNNTVAASASSLLLLLLLPSPPPSPAAAALPGSLKKPAALAPRLASLLASLLALSPSTTGAAYRGTAGTHLVATCSRPAAVANKEAMSASDAKGTPCSMAPNTSFETWSPLKMPGMIDCATSLRVHVCESAN